MAINADPPLVFEAIAAFKVNPLDNATAPKILTPINNVNCWIGFPKKKQNTGKQTDMINIKKIVLNINFEIIRACGLNN